jgi:hypothetical protein
MTLSKKGGRVLDAMRTCPSCGTRVLPTGDNICPACREYDFGAATPVVAHAMAPPPLSDQAREDLRIAAILYRQFLLCYAVMLLVQLVLAVGGIRRNTAAETVCLVLLVAAAIANLTRAYPLAKRLGLPDPVFWIVGMLVPYIGALVFLGFLRRVIGRFRSQGLRVGLIGPDPEAIRALPSRQP